MKKKDQEAIAKLVLEMYQDTQQPPVDTQRYRDAKPLENMLVWLSNQAYDPTMKNYSQWLQQASTQLQSGQGIDDNSYDQSMNTLNQIASDPNVNPQIKNYVSGFLQQKQGNRL